MTRVRYQVFFEEKECKFIERLCKRYGWTPSQLLERMLFFYRWVQDEMDSFTIYYDETGDFDEDNPMDWPVIACQNDEMGEAVDCETPYTDYIRLIQRLKEGLTPKKGFGDNEEDEEYHG